MKLLKSIFLSVAMLSTSTLAIAQEAKEQYFPLLSYRVGPYGAGGAGFFGGVIDYFNLVNQRGGVNGVKLVWEECETEYNTSRGVECYERLKNLHSKATIVDPMSTGIAYGILERTVTDGVPLVTMGYGRSESMNGEVFPNVFPLLATYWSAAAAMTQYLADEVGGEDQLKDKKIVLLYHDSAYGKEPWPVLDAQSERIGFELVKIAVSHPGNEQQSQWLQIRQLKPDYVILWGWGVMNTVALRTAQRYGFPREKILGSWWAGSEEDVIPAGDAAKGYKSLALNSPGNYALLDEIREKLYGAGNGNLSSASSIGSVYHLRGVTAAILWTEAMAAAQKKFGADGPLTGEQMRWGLENLTITPERQKELGVEGLFAPIKTSCQNHEGAGAVKVQQWDGDKWVAVSSDWVKGDQDLLAELVQKASGSYAKEHNITPECKS
ncbi:ABC transporter substrate-binding protein [Alcaligenes phenolicus]|uniref:ABC transporter substrate-binding protein n=1 Tax=Alcaligenes phenolicus TaxID=232846 RepID=A0AAW5VTP7_9BURK|nr:ABC transporter substrate-binding protein [Alcaligenes phenolicus]MCX5564286.1 ABC transporter substrate-binding protein [Alcaligenes phenolicus]